MKPLTRPMKAVSLLGPNDIHDNDTIFKALCGLKKWPKIATLKVDGIRAVRTTDLMSCRNKMLPNINIRRRSMSCPYGSDWELVSYFLQYDEIESIVMSEEHPDSDKIIFHGIDLYSELPYEQRLSKLQKFVMDWQMDYDNADDWYFKTPYILVCNTPTELFNYFLQCEEENGEGICFRTPDSPYKQGKSTLREEYLIKLCRYERTEVEITGVYEQMLNRNSSHRNSVGLTERSKAIGAMVGKETLGGFYVRDRNGLNFKVGTGVSLTEKKRKDLWDNQELLIGKTITIKHKPHGQKLKPRSPVFIGFRDVNYI